MNTRAKSTENLRAVRLAKSLIESQVAPSASERTELLQFNGWGTIREIFSPKHDWQKEAKAELMELLTPDEYDYASMSILNAFYTSNEVIDGIWQGLSRLGFSEGKILEPSCGSLRFKERQPQHLQNHSQWFAIEQDSITGQIAKLLHPDALVYDGLGFEDVRFPNGAFDLAIGNVPFGDYSVYDSDYAHLGLKIHNYFIAKSLNLTRIGGLLALITSVGTMDAPTSFQFRKMIAENAELLGAMRLPNTAFKQDANTEATTDILLLRKTAKKEIDTTDPNYLWIHSQPLKDLDFSTCFPELTFEEKTSKITFLSEFGIDIESEFALNYYYLRNPQNLLGVAHTDKLYGGRFGLKGDGRDLTEAISLTVESVLPQKTYEPTPTPINFIPIPPRLMQAPALSFCIWEENVYQRYEDELIEVDPKNCDRIKSMISLYDVLDEVMDAQGEEDDRALFEARQNLNTHYDSFVKQYGYLNSVVNKDILAIDASRYCLLMSLEVPAEECLYSFAELLKSKSHWGKAAIFFQRTARANPQPLVADSAKDGLLVSLNSRGCVDLDWIADLTGKSLEEVIDELHEIDDPLIYYDPAEDRWVTKEHYLSGIDVRKKLRRAQEERLEKNIEALIKIQPLYLLPPSSIDMRVELAAEIGAENCNLDILASFESELGASWFPAPVYEAFANFLIPKGNIYIRYFPSPINAFSVKADGEARQSVENKATWGTNRKTFLQLLESALNLRDPIVYDVFVDKAGNEFSEKNPEETQNAIAKLKSIKQAFKNWVWSDKTRALELTHLYNQNYNCAVVRQYNGEHLTLPNCNPDVNFRNYQKDGIWRCLTEPATILGWAVGAGKTRTFIAATMELKRLELVNNPLLVVLDSTVPQIEAEFRELYPFARLLVLGPITPSPQQRRRFVTQIVTGNWDAVIISHTQFFQGIQLSPSATAEFLEKELQIINEYLEEVEADSDEDEKRISLRHLNAAKKRTEARIEEVISGIKYKKDKKTGQMIAVKSTKRDRVINIDQIKPGLIVFDEFHYAKNVWRHTKMGAVAGLPNPNSERGIDTFMKVRWLLENGGRFIGATGTPISNTLAEGWTMLRYGMLEQLTERGLDHFDTFASLFLRMSSEPEISSTGRYKVKKRCRELINRPEFMGLYRSLVDIRTAEKLKLDNVPESVLIPVNCPPSPQQKSYMDYLNERADAIEAGSLDPEIDNMAWVTIHSRQGALDIRLVSPDGENCIYSKINAAVMNMYRIWSETRHIKAVQVAFINFSSPKTDERFDLYRYMKAALVALGIPEERIRFIHECDASTKAQTNKRRKELYLQANAGEIDIVFGSIQKLGTGVNIQRRLLCGHFVDCPWTPAEIDQGEGRIKRFGNLCSKILLFRYVTEGKIMNAGVDSYLWQTQEIKSKQIWSTLDIDNPARTVEDLTPTVLSAATMKAIACGDPRLRRKAEVDNEVKALTLQRHGFEQTVLRTKSNIRTEKSEIKYCTEKIERVARQIAHVDAFEAEQPIIIKGEEIFDRSRVVEILKEQHNALQEHAGARKKEAEKLMRKAKRKGLPTPSEFFEDYTDGFDTLIGTYLGLEIEVHWTSSSGGGCYITIAQNNGLEPWSYNLSNYFSSPKEVEAELTREGLKSLMDSSLSFTRIKLKRSQEDLISLESIDAERFPQEELLLALIEEQKELEEAFKPKIEETSDDSSTSDEEEERDDTVWEQRATPAKFVGVEPDIVMGMKLILEESEKPDWYPHLMDAIASFRGDKETLEEEFEFYAQTTYESFAYEVEDEPEEEEEVLVDADLSQFTHNYDSWLEDFEEDEPEAPIEVAAVAVQEEDISSYGSFALEVDDEEIATDYGSFLDDLD